ncbi:MAG: patatin-like phospholipase family protein [Prolixibacteraceae bacterium]|nr:patatin-like phospholipase family protein [Prolixibacteraceae bacterium]
MKKLKKAIVFTGSAGTLSQETAILDQLLNRKYFDLDPETTFLSGFGSGALNAIAVNACFRKENPCSWDNFYKENFIKNFNEEEIFLKVHPVNWNTHPLRKNINEFLKVTGLKKLSDLNFNTSIAVSLQYTSKTIWLNSKSIKHAYTNLSDLLMATMAMPVLFPPQQINMLNDMPSFIPDGAYVDGATNGISNRFKKHLKSIIDENGPFEEMYIISPARDTDIRKETNHNLSMMNIEEKLEFNDYVENVSLNGFLKFLIRLQNMNSKGKIAKKIYTCIPQTKTAPNILNFNNQVDNYNQVFEWFENNPNELNPELEKYILSIAYSPSFPMKTV